MPHRVTPTKAGVQGIFRGLTSFRSNLHFCHRLDAQPKGLYFVPTRVELEAVALDRNGLELILHQVDFRDGRQSGRQFDAYIASRRSRRFVQSEDQSPIATRLQC